MGPNSAARDIGGLSVRGTLCALVRGSSQTADRKSYRGKTFLTLLKTLFIERELYDIRDYLLYHLISCGLSQFNFIKLITIE